tara:strand:- start:1908 stop:2507 length:600 start_codon:yes stop_codon:yes gene_type:complete
MEIIAHRINKISKLKSLPKKYGSEIDLRSVGSKIILNHDPHKNGDKLEDYLANYNHGTLILNIKEAGLEYEAIRLAKKHKIKNFFLLDVEMPLICINKKKINKYMSIRFSEYEPIQTISKFKKNVGWIWIDTFKTLPINKKNSFIIKKFNSCLVCPERWGRPYDINRYFKFLRKIKFFPGSVMTNLKYAKKWENLLLNF